MNFRYIILQIFYWIMFSAIYAYANPYLMYKGFDSSQIGAIIAIASILSVFVQPLTANLIDKYRKITVKRSLIVSMLVISIMSLLLIFLNNKIIVSLIFIFAIVGLLNVQIYMYTFIFEYINTGVYVNFGLARGMGSLSFAISSLAYGKLGDKLSFSFIPFLSFILSLVVIIIILSFEKVKKENHNIEIVVKLNIVEFLKKYKEFMYVLLGIMLVIFTHSTLNTFLNNIVNTFGKGSSELGIALMLASIVELPVMYSIPKLNKKISYKNLIKISALFFTLKSFVSLLSVMSSNIYLLYLAQLLQFGAYAIYMPVVVYYTNDVMEEEDRVKGQAYMSTSATIGAVLGSIIGGQIINIFNVVIMLIVITFVSLLGTIILLKKIITK